MCLKSFNDHSERDGATIVNQFPSPVSEPLSALFLNCVSLFSPEATKDFISVNFRGLAQPLPKHFSAPYGLLLASTPLQTHLNSVTVLTCSFCPPIHYPLSDLVLFWNIFLGMT